MKLILLLASMLLSVVPVFAGGALTKAEWIAAINRDSRESALEAKLGLPSFKKSSGGVIRYYWLGKLDTGSTSSESLAVQVAPYKGVMLVVAIYDPVSEECTFFPWYDKVLKAQ